MKVHSLTETVIGLHVFGAGAVLFQPADAGDGRSIEVWNIGLDIEERRAVEDIHILYREDIIFNPDEFDNGHPKRIGALGGAGGKYAAGFGIQEGGYLEAMLLDLVEMVKEDDVGKAVQVFDAFRKFWEDLHLSLNSRPTGGLDWHTFYRLERGVDEADGRI